MSTLRFLYKWICVALLIYSGPGMPIAQAEECSEEFNELRVEAGFYLQSRQLRLLERPQYHLRQLSRAEYRRRIQRRIQKRGTPRNRWPRRYDHGASQPSAQTLAAEIELAAHCFGLDPRVFAAMIETESVYAAGAISHTGARGLTQMTTIARRELRDQFGYRRGHAHPRAAGILRSMARCYFDSGDQAYQSFLAWIQNPSRNRQRLTRHWPTALAAGAALLKTYLAVHNGDYDRALQQYNGEARRQVAYSRQTRGFASSISLQCGTHPEDEQFALGALIRACEMLVETEDCYEDIVSSADTETIDI